MFESWGNTGRLVTVARSAVSIKIVRQSRHSEKELEVMTIMIVELNDSVLSIQICNVLLYLKVQR